MIIKNSAFEAYQEALEETRLAAVTFSGDGSPAEFAPVKRFEGMFGQFTPDALKVSIPQTYAENAFMNDTVKTVRGSAAICDYLVKTAERAQAVIVRINDVAVSGVEFYVRWRMEINWGAFQKGKTTVSEGISQLRFDHEGKVILHQDFWDPASGLFQYLPVIGGLLRWLKNRF